MPKVYIADKETLDNVKQDTNNIKESISNVTNNVQYIKNQFPLTIAGGTDWSRYETLEKNLKIDKYIRELNDNNILEINGKGYIKDLIVRGSFEVTIYVDSKEVYKNKTYDSNDFRYLGFYNTTDYFNNSSSRWIANYFFDEQYTSVHINAIAQPIFFENNVKVIVNGYNIRELYFLGGVEK